jgi:hypothetical protein
MAGLTEATFKLLKRVYNFQKLEEMFYKDSPLLGMIQKHPLGGTSVQIPLIYGGVANRSATFSDAIAGSGHRRSLQWNITATENFNFAEVDHKAILAAKMGDKASFVQALQFTIEGAYKQMSRDISATMFKDGSGLIGTLSAASAGNPTGTITFTSRQAMREVFVDSRISIFSDAALTTLVGTVTVTKVDKTSGVATYSGDGSGFLAGHFAVAKGDANLKFKGLTAWLPYGSTRAAAVAASFFGVDRSEDPSLLAGIEYDATGDTIKEALIRGEEAIRTIGGGPAIDLIVMSPRTLAALKIELMNQYIVGNEPGSVAGISYSTVKLNFMDGNVNVLSDGDCPDGVAFMLNKDTWRLGHMGSTLVNGWDEDGLDAIRSTSSNSLRMQWYSYVAPFCSAPAYNGVIHGLPIS